MSDTLGTYCFLPWLRVGVANNLTAADADPAVRVRASIAVDLELTGRPLAGEAPLTATVSRQVALYGPGDVVGIDPREIVKTEPRDRITNFEPNYMPYVEFYEEDFPWRYTPAAPDLGRHRLRPWLALVVLAEGEFDDARPISSRPLPAFEIQGTAADLFPPADQLWAWAHVHINRDLLQQKGVFVPNDADATRSRLEALLRNNPDHAYSRLLSPRRLEPETGYHAFIVPSFESGRLAGLGLGPDLANPAFFATLSAWADYPQRPQSGLYPYYRRWYFKTGSVGDFEYLVRLLKPRPPDSRLGRRDMDVQRPGSNLPGIANPDLDGVLRLGGALQVPAEALTDAQEAEAKKYEDWDQPYPHVFQDSLARFVNLSDDYAIDGEPDPVIVAPLYGRWHALTDRLLFEHDDADTPQNQNWVHELNLDPRWRVPAGFGTAVIQDKQEEYMDAAWEQVGEVIEANRRIRLALLAREVSVVWHRRHLTSIRQQSAERALVMTAPVHRRVLAGGVTVRHALARSTVPRAALSAPLRRALRPRDHVARALGFDAPKGPERLLERLNREEVSAAPPRVTPEELPTVEEVAGELQPQALPSPWLDWVRRHPWAKWVLLVLLLLLALLLFFAAGPLVALPVAAGAVVLVGWLARLEHQAGIAHAVLADGSSPEEIERLPRFPAFEVRDPVVPPLDPATPEPRPGPGDNPEAERFKVALGDVHRLLTVSATLGRPPVRTPIEVAVLAEASLVAIDPERTVPAFTLAGLTFPLHLIALNGEVFREAMAYPVFDIPMYKPLLDLGDEHFLPNIDKLPPNTITLLETNQRFIESYMVGVNHEFARELLWREFPTDQRGSYFRQFWDPSGVIDRQGLSKEARREKLRDIPPLHTWSRFSKLGDHDHREQPGEKEEEVVLVIRGELLKRYPTAVIYAQKARWRRKPNGDIDPGQERELETAGPLEDRLRTPLYEAKVDPDVTFLGFDLNAEEVRGGSGRPGDAEPGWFFVIKERPGEPRFGLDVEREGQLNVWNDLAWPDVRGDGFLEIGGPTLTLIEPTDDTLAEKSGQYEEDRVFRWHADTNAAELAYILYQVPVLVAVHGHEMLPN